MPDAWLDLVAPAEAHELRACLLRLKNELTSAPVAEPPIAERLRRLRAELSARDLDGLIVPLTDEHRNEYVPACAQRLAWLTGFTGSAGVLIVLAERAAVFVDGRYTRPGGGAARSEAVRAPSSDRGAAGEMARASS